MFRTFVVYCSLALCLRSEGALSLSDFLPDSVQTSETSRTFLTVSEDAITAEVAAITARKTQKMVERICARLLSNARNGQLRIHNWNGLLYVSSHAAGLPRFPAEFQGLERVSQRLQAKWSTAGILTGLDLGDGFILDASRFRFAWNRFTNVVTKDYRTESGAKGRLTYYIRFTPQGSVNTLEIVLSEERENAALGVREVRSYSLKTLLNGDLRSVDLFLGTKPLDAGPADDFKEKMGIDFNANGNFAGWYNDEKSMGLNETIHYFFGRPAQRPLRVSRQFLVHLIQAAREEKDFAPHQVLDWPAH